MLWFIYYHYGENTYGLCRADKWMKADFDAYNRIRLLRKKETPPSYSILDVLPTEEEAKKRLTDFTRDKKQ